jgi:hypothetical protein
MDPVIDSVCSKIILFLLKNIIAFLLTTIQNKNGKEIIPYIVKKDK